LNSFSQTVIETRQVPNNDTVKIHIDIAKKIAKDLSLLDVLKEERVLLKQNIDTITFQRDTKDSIIVRKNDQIGLYKSSIDLYKQKEDVYKTTLNKLDLQLSKAKLKNKLGWTTAAILVVYTLVRK
tara:strand:+ start:759 stop:1136 length:378 start_codon:yes stop_codon:yes gene_type:complete